MPDVAPQYQVSAFNCPLCGAYAAMRWGQMQAPWQMVALAAAQCAHCGGFSIWSSETALMIWPRVGVGVKPHEQMPAAVLELYREGQAVSAESPRAAAALLRVAVDVLLREVVPDSKGKTLNQVIRKAVEGGLNPSARAALDVLRVTGNDAVHPEQQILLDEQDPLAKVHSLCKLLNLVVEQLIATPRMAREMLDALPPEVLASIEKRDGSLPDFGS